MRSVLRTLFLMLFPLLAFGQTDTGLYHFQSRMHMVSPDELLMMDEAGKGFFSTPPPGGRVRSIAEWEPAEGVIVGYSGQFGIPYSLIAQMSQVAKVYTIVANASTENSVRNLYTANGVNISNCIFVHGPLNSYWTRDYSPWFIADSANRVAIVDFPYNRPRPNDNAVPALFAQALGLPLYGMDLKHTGGNYMCDGFGKAASTQLVITENPTLTIHQINTMVNQYLGIDQYYKIADPLGDYIEHIDCWGKFLAPDKVLLGQVPSNDPRYQDYEVVATFFANEPSSYGYPYEVHRVYSPNGQPYTNSFILNNKVFLPIVTTYGTPWNDSAIAVYQRALPGYDIVGVNALSSKPWATTDALHCRVHEIPDLGMLYIRHKPLKGVVIQQQSYEVRAEIISYSDTLLYSDSILINYRYNAGSWHQVLMTPDTGYVWTGLIPDSAKDVTISYSIHAADMSGRSENHPYIGKAGAHSFTVKSTIGIPSSDLIKRDILVFPNPCDDKVYAAIPNPAGERVLARIFNLSGQMILETQFVNEHALYRDGIDVRNIKNGVYLLDIVSGGKRFRQKIMVVHQ